MPEFDLKAFEREFRTYRQGLVVAGAGGRALISPRSAPARARAVASPPLARGERRRATRFRCRTATGWPSSWRAPQPRRRDRDPGRADKDGVHGTTLDPESSSSHSNERSWRPNALRSVPMSSRPRWSRSSMIMPAQVPSTGVPPRASSRSDSARPSRSIPSASRLTPAGDDEPSRSVETSGARTSRAWASSRAGPSACASKPPCRARMPTDGWPAGRPTSRGARAAARARASSSRGPPSAGRARGGGGDPSGSSKCVVASTMARAMRTGSSLLKMPEPTKTASAPELHDE